MRLNAIANYNYTITLAIWTKGSHKCNYKNH